MTSTAVELPIRQAAAADGGRPARRAIVRWAWRLFRREWRRQALVLALLVVALAAIIVGLGVVTSAFGLKADPQFGTANSIVSLTDPGSDLTADLAALQNRFGTIDVIAHQTLPIAGSVSTLDVRAQNPAGAFGHVTLRLDSGHFPTGAGQIAVTSGVAQTFGLHVGSSWTLDGQTRKVVGLVENPLNLLDDFALVPPGQANPPTYVSVLLNAPSNIGSFNLPSGGGLNVSTRGTGSQVLGDTLVLILGTLGLIFVGLMAVAGFSVMAQRRLRALGMLGSLGATDRHLRMVMLANGAAVGATAAIAGAVVGFAAWFALTPGLQSLTEHRIDRFALPWWAIGAALVLAFITAIAAAWWPARSLVKTPIVAALSERPPRPQPGHRLAALGGTLLAGGIVLLAFSDRNRAPFIIVGTAATAIGLLFLAPLAIRLLALAGRRSAISVRLALRDLVRYQARSGAALGAVTLAIGISATICVAAASAQTPTGPGNLPTNQMVLYTVENSGQTPPLSAAQYQSLTTTVDRLASSIHAGSAVELDQAYNPDSGIQPAQPAGPGQGPIPPGYLTASLAVVTPILHGEEVSSQRNLYVATPAVLAKYGINLGEVNPNADILSPTVSLGRAQVFTPNLPNGSPPPPGALRLARRAGTMPDPTVQRFRQLPAYTSDPGVLITSHAMQVLGLDAIPSAWLIQTPHPLTAAQIDTARQQAGSAGLYLETTTHQGSLAPLRNWSTTAGILLALGVLGMTVGLIRSETANDLRTLAATGAASWARRSLTAVTAGALALLGAVLGTAGAYAALAAWYRSNLGPLDHVPLANLLFILIGLPLIAGAGAWLLAGREPPTIARRPLE